mmetsp:Transcript_92994/g.277597  ORF Transcript_92994/g.277597 Transcript_92994/m.277597 type:complete len:283 (+) Transcript_92994:812-1660(+)
MWAVSSGCVSMYSGRGICGLISSRASRSQMSRVYSDTSCGSSSTSHTTACMSPPLASSSLPPNRSIVSSRCAGAEAEAVPDVLGTSSRWLLRCQPGGSPTPPSTPAWAFLSESVGFLQDGARFCSSPWQRLRTASCVAKPDLCELGKFSISGPRRLLISSRSSSTPGVPAPGMQEVPVPTMGKSPKSLRAKGSSSSSSLKLTSRGQPKPVDSASSHSGEGVPLAPGMDVPNQPEQASMAGAWRGAMARLVMSSKTQVGWTSCSRRPPSAPLAYLKALSPVAP